MIARHVRSVDTLPELLLRQALRKRGLRYRINVDELPGRPDIVIVGDRVAIFCDGGFWHGRNWASRRAALAEGSNSSCWLQKIHANRIRDHRICRDLRSLGWNVVRLWEGDIKRDIEGAVAKVLRAIRAGIFIEILIEWSPRVQSKDWR